MSYIYKNRVTRDNIDEFQAGLNQHLGELQEYLRQYKLTIKGNFLTYGDNGIQIKISTEYALDGGAKPWEDHTLREDIERYLSYINPTDSNYQEAIAFKEALPIGELLGRKVHIPGSSKRYPNETFTVTGWRSGDRYPLKLIRDRDGRDWQYELLWGMRFVN